jgi:hypothetical protein
MAIQDSSVGCMAYLGAGKGWSLYYTAQTLGPAVHMEPTKRRPSAQGMLVSPWSTFDMSWHRCTFLLRIEGALTLCPLEVRTKSHGSVLTALRFVHGKAVMATSLLCQGQY